MPLGEHATTHRMRESAGPGHKPLTLIDATTNEVISDGQVIPPTPRTAINHTAIVVAGERFDVFSSTPLEERHVVEWEPPEVGPPSSQSRDSRRKARAEQLDIFFRGLNKQLNKS
jgi:hypothetical protein